ncbi:hypothetical protein BY996DRAFT_6418153 [Phakopsora pachyrhizi]|nr:hypothetical protein BY996DRAFT_6418153 [Phakopsora pachyrhizi]
MRRVVRCRGFTRIMRVATAYDAELGRREKGVEGRRVGNRKSQKTERCGKEIQGSGSRESTPSRGTIGVMVYYLLHFSELWKNHVAKLMNRYRKERCPSKGCAGLTRGKVWCLQLGEL